MAKVLQRFVTGFSAAGSCFHHAKRTQYTVYRGERFNCITHLIGAAAALVGLVALLYLAVQQGDPVKTVSLSVYGVSLFLMYLFSVLYHSFRGKWKRFFQTLDHVAIYLLIAGTYTPFTLVSLEGNWGWWLLGIIWGLAVVGILLDILPKKRHEALVVTIYIIMGWLCVIAVRPLLQALSVSGFLWLLAGGLFYTVGVIFYALDYKRHFHGIWHLFVLAGSTCHYITILVYVA